jgi:hypothetical protein
MAEKRRRATPSRLGESEAIVPVKKEKKTSKAPPVQKKQKKNKYIKRSFGGLPLTVVKIICDYVAWNGLHWLFHFLDVLQDYDSKRVSEIQLQKHYYHTLGASLVRNGSFPQIASTTVTWRFLKHFPILQLGGSALRFIPQLDAGQHRKVMSMVQWAVIYGGRMCALCGGTRGIDIVRFDGSNVETAADFESWELVGDQRSPRHVYAHVKCRKERILALGIWDWKSNPEKKKLPYWNPDKWNPVSIKKPTDPELQWMPLYEDVIQKRLFVSESTEPHFKTWISQFYTVDAQDAGTLYTAHIGTNRSLNLVVPSGAYSSYQQRVAEVVEFMNFIVHDHFIRERNQLMRDLLLDKTHQATMQRLLGPHVQIPSLVGRDPDLFYHLNGKDFLKRLDQALCNFDCPVGLWMPFPFVGTEEQVVNLFKLQLATSRIKECLKCEGEWVPHLTEQFKPEHLQTMIQWIWPDLSQDPRKMHLVLPLSQVLTPELQKTIIKDVLSRTRCVNVDFRKVLEIIKSPPPPGTFVISP